jgi:hypothetical protein
MSDISCHVATEMNSQAADRATEKKLEERLLEEDRQETVQQMKRIKE